MSREIKHSNKAPRHHNDIFESNKRFIETVAELRKKSNLLMFLSYMSYVFGKIVVYSVISGSDYIIAVTDYIIAATDFIITVGDYRIY